MVACVPEDVMIGGNEKYGEGPFPCYLHTGLSSRFVNINIFIRRSEKRGGKLNFFSSHTPSRLPVQEVIAEKTNCGWSAARQEINFIKEN